MPRPKKEDPRTVYERQLDFLRAYSENFIVARAAEVAKVHRDSHYRWLRTNKLYAAEFKKRREIAAQYLETLAIERAVYGWLEPVYYLGVVCGQVRRYDSGLMQFLLKGMLPQKYGARQETGGPQVAPTQAKIEVVFVRPDAIDLQA